MGTPGYTFADGKLIYHNAEGDFQFATKGDVAVCFDALDGTLHMHGLGIAVETWRKDFQAQLGKFSESKVFRRMLRDLRCVIRPASDWDPEDLNRMINTTGWARTWHEELKTSSTDWKEIHRTLEGISWKAPTSRKATFGYLAGIYYVTYRRRVNGVFERREDWVIGPPLYEHENSHLAFLFTVAKAVHEMVAQQLESELARIAKKMEERG